MLSFVLLIFKNTGIHGWIPSKRFTPIDNFLIKKEQKLVHKVTQVPLPPTPQKGLVPKSLCEQQEVDMAKEELEENIQDELYNDDNFPPEIPIDRLQCLQNVLICFVLEKEQLPCFI
jgi:hypothetical protein